MKHGPKPRSLDTYSMLSQLPIVNHVLFQEHRMLSPDPINT